MSCKWCGESMSGPGEMHGQCRDAFELSSIGRKYRMRRVEQLDLEADKAQAMADRNEDRMFEADRG